MSAIVVRGEGVGTCDGSFVSCQLSGSADAYDVCTDESRRPDGVLTVSKPFVQELKEPRRLLDTDELLLSSPLLRVTRSLNLDLKE